MLHLLCELVLVGSVWLNPCHVTSLETLSGRCFAHISAHRRSPKLGIECEKAVMIINKRIRDRQRRD